MGTIADLDIKLGLEGTVRKVLYEVLRGEWRLFSEQVMGGGGKDIPETTGLANSVANSLKSWIQPYTHLLDLDNEIVLSPLNPALEMFYRRTNVEMGWRS